LSASGTAVPHNFSLEQTAPAEIEGAAAQFNCYVDEISFSSGQRKGIDL
jgi:hypothetical protein